MGKKKNLNARENKQRNIIKQHTIECDEILDAYMQTDAYIVYTYMRR